MNGNGEQDQTRIYCTGSQRCAFITGLPYMDNANGRYVA